MEGKLLSQLAASTNTASRLMTSPIIFKDMPAASQVCTSPAQPPGLLKMALVATSNGPPPTTLPTSLDCPTMTFSRHPQPGTSHVTSSMDISMSATVPQTAVATSAALHTHACTRKTGRMYTEQMLDPPTTLPTSLDCRTVTFSHNPQPGTSHVTLSMDISMSATVPRTAVATSAALHTHACTRKVGPMYTEQMLDIYGKVASHGKLNFWGA